MFERKPKKELIRNKEVGPGEIVRAIASLAKDPVQFPAPKPGDSKPPVTPVPGDLMPFGLCGHLHTHGSDTDKQAHIQYKNNYILKK